MELIGSVLLLGQSPFARLLALVIAKAPIAQRKDQPISGEAPLLSETCRHEQCKQGKGEDGIDNGNQAP